MSTTRPSSYNSPTPAVARARRAFERRLEVERRRQEAARRDPGEDTPRRD